MRSLQGIITAEVADHSLSRLGQVNSWHQTHGQLIQEQDSAQGRDICGILWHSVACAGQEYHQYHLNDVESHGLLAEIPLQI